MCGGMGFGMDIQVLGLEEWDSQGLAAVPKAGYYYIIIIIINYVFADKSCMESNFHGKPTPLSMTPIPV